MYEGGRVDCSARGGARLKDGRKSFGMFHIGSDTIERSVPQGVRSTEHCTP